MTLGCPIKRLTGIPCPSCGTTRAFVLLARRDPRWRDYNTICVGYAAASLTASVALSILPAPIQAVIVRRVEALGERLREKPALAVACATLIALPPWLLALRRPTIHN